MTGVTTHNGLAYYLDNAGLPEGGGIPPGMVDWPSLRGGSDGVPVVLVHGFDYDPWKNSDDNPHFMGPLGKMSTFGMWRRDLVPDRAAIGLGWYSAPVGLRGVLRAWRSGRWNRYRYAFDLAWEAGRVLSVMLRRLDGPVDVLCHSLGSRVALAALAQERGLPVRNLLIMNGAELVKTGEPIARANPQVNFTNLVVQSDKVLKYAGAKFAPEGGFGAVCLGQVGLGKDAPSNWRDVDLDDPVDQAWGRERGWNLKGDNPMSRGDHWYTYRHKGNRGMIRAALSGEV